MTRTEGRPPLSSAPTTRLRRIRCNSEVRAATSGSRSEEHTSELQSHLNLVCRLLLEKKKTKRSKLNFHDQPSIRTIRTTSSDYRVTLTANSKPQDMRSRRTTTLRQSGETHLHHLPP